MEGCGIDDGTINPGAIQGTEIFDYDTALRAYDFACLRDTVMSLRKMPLEGSRPIVISSPSSSKLFPRLRPLDDGKYRGGNTGAAHEIGRGGVVAGHTENACGVGGCAGDIRLIGVNHNNSQLEGRW